MWGLFIGADWIVCLGWLSERTAIFLEFICIIKFIFLLL